MQPTSHTSEELVLRLGDRLVEGWITTPGCPDCGGPRVYVLAYDATCCPECNRWLELLCPDPECVHCRCRPERPF
jgi:hypothetical protein